MFTLNRAERNALVLIFTLMAIIFALGVFRVSNYQPRPITINAVSEESIFDLENKIECTPGNKKGSPYTKSLTPGGLCGIQELVSKQAGYEISDGIGGTLI